MAEVQPFSDKQRSTFRKKFLKLSIDGETISIDDLLKLIQLVGQNTTKKQFNDALLECELQSKSYVSYDEFEAVLWTVWTDQELEKELLKSFKQFDKDGNGYLDAEEFKNVMLNYGETLTHDELNDLMRIVDVNQDGKVDYEEFIKAMVESTPDDADDEDHVDEDVHNENLTELNKLEIRNNEGAREGDEEQNEDDDEDQSVDNNEDTTNESEEVNETYENHQAGEN